MLGLPFIKWYGFFPFACVWIRSVEQILNSSMLQAEETTKVSAVDTFETGRFFLVLVCSADVPVQMLLAERAPHYPVNTQGSRSYGRAKGQEWLRQYVIWLSSPGHQSLEKDTQFALPRSGAEPVSEVGDVIGMVTNPHACYKHH